MSKILFEPFKIKAVEALPISTMEERRRWIEESDYNLFSLRSDQITIDLLTDSGTSAMSDLQWAAMMSADESYAGSRSFTELEATARALTGMEFIIPVHQGRAAEHILFSTILREGDVVLSNGLFDTTRANIDLQRGKGIDLPSEEGLDPFFDHPFKGNIDLDKLEATLREAREKVRLVLMTVTNNSGGGQPVSLENIKNASEIARKYGKLFVLDACRFAENAYFIKLRESDRGVRELSAHRIAQLCFSYADVITFSGKKDAFANIGGLLCLRDKKLSSEMKSRMIVVEGFPSYGGLAGYSMAAMNQGLKEVLDERYLEYRLRTISWITERLAAAGIPVLRPPGGHAVYIESSRFYPHIRRETFPGIALAVELYMKGGVRCCELGSVAFGRRNSDGTQILPPLDLVRLAFPRRVYTEAHAGYVVECLEEIYSEREKVRGFEFQEESPVMRHFLSKFKRLA